MRFIQPLADRWIQVRRQGFDTVIALDRNMIESYELVVQIIGIGGK